MRSAATCASATRRSRPSLERYGVRQATELIVCCSYFNMLSRFLESTRVEIEAEDLVGEQTPEKIAPSE